MVDKNKLARDRTDWAEDRTTLAAERTFAGWLRTGMAAIAVALGLKAVFGDFDPTWVAKAVASIFLVMAIFIFWSARNQACKTFDTIRDRDASSQPTGNYTLMAVVFSFGAISVGIILWLL